MFDSRVRRLIDPPLNRAAHSLAAWGAAPNGLTAAGLGFSVCAFAALFFRLYPLALLFILLNRLMDGVDGPVARVTGVTDLGGFYDILSDFIFYAGAIFFFAAGRPEMALAAGFLIYSFFGSGGSLLAAAILAAKSGVPHDQQERKSFYYQAGLMEGTETVFVLLLICLRPDWFPWIAYIFGALCWVTTLGRVRHAASRRTG